MTLTQTSRIPPGPPGDSLAEVQADPMRTFLRDAFTYGGIVRYQFGNRQVYMISDPKMIQQMLVSNREKYIKSSRYDVLLPIVGRGLLLSEGADWRRQNAKARPAFRPAAMVGQWPAMVKAVADRLDQWPAWVTSGEVVDIEAEMTRITQAIVGPWTMGEIYWRYADDFAEHLETMRRYLANPVRGTWGALTRRFHRSTRDYHRAEGELDRIFREIAVDVRRRGGAGDDFLSKYLKGYLAAGVEVSDEELRDQCATIFVPGHETSSSTLAWTWYVLATVPGIRQRVQEEVSSILGDRQLTVADLPKLSYCRRVIEEVLRLYSPACSFARTAVEDDEVGGYAIAGGSQVIVCAYATHRLPAYWPEPEQFNPDRFLPEAVEARAQWSYYPFGLGQRGCIGSEFGLLQVALILAMVSQRFRLELMPGHLIVNEYNVVLRPRGGMKMTVHPAGTAGK